MSSILWMFVMYMYICLDRVYTHGNHSLCVWGRHGYNALINGEYQHEGYFNAAPQYNKQYGASVFYIWRVDSGNDQFVITYDPPGTSPQSLTVFATCINQTLFPWQCGYNQWTVWQGTQFSIDPQVYASNGSCPDWHFCDAIVTNISHQRCNETFDIQIARNAWSNQAGDRYFWFHEAAFRWLCTSSDQYKPFSSSLSYFAVAASGWIDTSLGSSVYIPFQLATATPSNFYQIDCIKRSTISPSTPPTQEPSIETTQTPSLAPSAEPSPSPSMNPTFEPIANTRSPSFAPSDVSSQSPSAAPSEFRTILPSNHASLSPVQTQSSSQSTTNEVSLTSMTPKLVIIAVLFTCICVIGLLCIFFLFWKRKWSDQETVAERSEKRESVSMSQNGPRVVHIRIDGSEVADTGEARRETQITAISDRSEGKMKEMRAAAHHHQDEGFRQPVDTQLHAEVKYDEFIVMGDDEITSKNTQQPRIQQDVETRDMTDDFVVMADDEFE